MEKHILTTEELSVALYEALREDGCFPLEITGNSMLPFLQPGRDVVWLREFHPESCKVGTILLFQRQNGRFVLHRVRRILPGGYRMNGDAQNWCEEISTEQVVAQVYQIRQKGKLLSCDCIRLKIRDFLWYFTRPFRPPLLRVRHYIKRIFDCLLVHK